MPNYSAILLRVLENKGLSKQASAEQPQLMLRRAVQKWAAVQDPVLYDHLDKNVKTPRALPEAPTLAPAHRQQTPGPAPVPPPRVATNRLSTTQEQVLYGHLDKVLKRPQALQDAPTLAPAHRQQTPGNPGPAPVPPPRVATNRLSRGGTAATHLPSLASGLLPGIVAFPLDVARGVRLARARRGMRASDPTVIELIQRRMQADVQRRGMRASDPKAVELIRRRMQADVQRRRQAAVHAPNNSTIK